MPLSQSGLGLTILLGLCAGLPALSIDLSAPTLTILPSALETDLSTAGLTLTLFMLGFAVGLVAGGRSSDARGRRPTLIIALVVYTFAGLCCAMATSGVALVAARCLQGVGAGACAVQAPAIVQDLFKGEEARRRQTYVTLVLTVVPLIAPAVGAIFVAHWGWRSVHVVLAFSGATLLTVVTLLFGETRRRSGQLIARGLGLDGAAQMLVHRDFRRVVVTNALSYGAIFAYISGAPAVVMGELRHSSAAYAVLFALTALGLSAGAATNVALARRGVDGMLTVRPGLVLQVGSTLVAVICGANLNALAGPLVVPALVLFCFARGLVAPNMTHLAVNAFGSQPGLAAAMLGLLQLLAGAGTSGVVAMLMPSLGYTGVALTMAASACIALIVWHLELRRVDRVEI